MARRFLEVLMDPYRPVSGRGDLLTFQIEKLVGRDIVRQNVVTLGLQDGRKDEAVENDVVLTDEVDQGRFFILPVGFPVFFIVDRPLLGRRNPSSRTSGPPEGVAPPRRPAACRAAARGSGSSPRVMALG